MLVCLSVIISYRRGKLYFYAPIGALVNFYVLCSLDLYNRWCHFWVASLQITFAVHLSNLYVRTVSELTRLVLTALRAAFLD